VLRNWRGVCCAVVVLVAGCLSATVTAGAGARPALTTAPAGVAVDGAVSAPATYSLPQLAALRQTDVEAPPVVPGGRTHTDQGVSLEALVNLAHPVLPSAKNALLRVTVTVTGGAGRTVTFALGELDPSFGDHPAYLVLTSDGRLLPGAPELVVPGDSVPTRSLAGVTEITVGVQSPGPTMPPSPGAVTVEDGSRTVVLDAHRLALLPAQTLSVSFLAGGGAQTHTETGPALSTVLAAAGVGPSSAAWVAAVGSDGYVATVTPAEATVGGRPLILSLREDGVALTQPRLVTDGDVKGGRYVSGVVDLVVGRAPPTG
jgi:hypothetical protein